MRHGKSQHWVLTDTTLSVTLRIGRSGLEPLRPFISDPIARKDFDMTTITPNGRALAIVAGAAFVYGGLLVILSLIHI